MVQTAHIGRHGVATERCLASAEWTRSRGRESFHVQAGDIRAGLVGLPCTNTGAQALAKKGRLPESLWFSAGAGTLCQWCAAATSFRPLGGIAANRSIDSPFDACPHPSSPGQTGNAPLTYQLHQPHWLGHSHNPDSPSRLMCQDPTDQCRPNHRLHGGPGWRSKAGENGDSHGCKAIWVG